MRPRIALSRVMRNYLSSSGQFKIETARATAASRACLRIAIAKTTRATEALACRASHDVDDNRRHAALHRARVGHRNFLWLHTALSAEDVIIDRGRMDLPMQQNCSCDSGDAARCPDLGDARDLCCRIPFGLLEPQSPGSTAGAFSSVWTGRLRALACIFTRRLAHLLACVCRFALPRRAFGDRYLFSYALAD